MALFTATLLAFVAVVELVALPTSIVLNACHTDELPLPTDVKAYPAPG